MDPDDHELIRCLCTKAGTIMEDMSVIAITKPGFMPESIEARVAGLAQAAEEITSLLAAAKAIARSKT
jgi:hypothetical protein